MVSSVTCKKFQDIYWDWQLMYKDDEFLIKDNLFLKELRKNKNEGEITIPNIYEQIVLSKKENLERVRVLGSGIKFKKTLPENISSKCDLYVSNNEFFESDQAALMSANVSDRSFFGNFAFMIFEKVEKDPFFHGKKVCKKGRIFPIGGVYLKPRFCGKNRVMFPI